MQAADAAAALQQSDDLHARGDLAGCCAALLALASAAQQLPRVLQDIALRFTALGRHEDAERCCAQARRQCPNDPQQLYNHAAALVAVGRLVDAEATLDAVIALAPSDGDAWYNRATLRKQTPQHQHVNALRVQCAATPAVSPMQVPLHYALAKELEDLGEYAAAFAALKHAADARRRGLSYRVEDDVSTMQLIADAFNADFFAGKHAGYDDARPLFVVGLPRSGTTLVDRILSSHTRVISRGESNDLALAMMHCAGPTSSKLALVRKAATLDFRALGQRYCGHLSSGDALRQIDKTPLNILYLGVVAAALPQARIVHLRRNPMDACYAMYKTLFRMGYPFSYDLNDLAHYWLGYDALMAHWRKSLPAERFLEVDYEDMVENQETVSRRLVAHAGLDWEDACLHFEHNPQASLTASAAQVRQPMYRSSLGLWRRYERELAPLAAQLRMAGIDINGGGARTSAA